MVVHLIHTPYDYDYLSLLKMITNNNHHGTGGQTQLLPPLHQVPGFL